MCLFRWKELDQMIIVVDSQVTYRVVITRWLPHQFEKTGEG